MAVLNISGKAAGQVLLMKLTVDHPVKIGRSPRIGWAVPWDAHISREHAEVTWTGKELQVKCLEAARNPLVFSGHTVRELVLVEGEEFSIGTTRFRLEPAEAAVADEREVVELTFSAEQLRKIRFNDPEVRIEHLSKLPTLIAGSTTPDEMAAKLVDLLIASMPLAAAVAIARFPLGENNVRDLDNPAPYRWSWNVTRSLGRFQPSRRLISSALESKAGVIHIWEDSGSSSFTRDLDFDWAFCVPVTTPGGDGWCLYVTGWSNGGGSRASSPIDKAALESDLKFSQLLAQFLGAVLETRQLRQQEKVLVDFIAPEVMDAVRQNNSMEILAPRMADVSVLFCDVRGFSRKAEQARHQLGELLTRVSSALGVMATAIVRYEGIIADFQGDAALGMWGWPETLPDGPVLACRAALEILASFSAAARRPGDPLCDFRVGIGVAHGPALAGRIGASQQAKFGVFGPTVNIGARLEGLTKQLRAPILVDEATAGFVRMHMAPGDARVRRLARVKPAGMQDAFWISELLPPTSLDNSVTDEQIAQFEAAADAVVQGDWPLALELLYKLPAADRAKEFLILHILQHQGQPPANWDGILTFSSK
jgi:adenylate cyclase